MSLMLLFPHEVAKHIAQHSRTKRLSLNFSQRSLSERSGVSLGVLKKFEGTGKISLESLLKIALALGCLGEFMELFKPTAVEKLPTLDELLKEKTRMRGRK